MQTTAVSVNQPLVLKLTLSRTWSFIVFNVARKTLPALTAASTPVWTPFFMDLKMEVRSTGFRSSWSLDRTPDERLIPAFPVPMFIIPEMSGFPEMEDDNESKNSGAGGSTPILIFSPILSNFPKFIFVQFSFFQFVANNFFWAKSLQNYFSSRESAVLTTSPLHDSWTNEVGRTKTNEFVFLPAKILLVKIRQFYAQSKKPFYSSRTHTKIRLFFSKSCIVEVNLKPSWVVFSFQRLQGHWSSEQREKWNSLGRCHWHWKLAERRNE